MIHRWTLPNGLTCLYQERPEVPLVAGTLFIRAGSRDESAREAGLSSFVMDMLMQGTRRKSAKKVADLVESIGGAMGAQSSEDYSEADFLVPAPHLERVLELLTEIVNEPGWRADEIKKQKEHVLSDLRTRHDSIFNVAYDRFRSELFQAHPYSRVSDGNEKTVRSFALADCARWHSCYLQPDRAVLSVIGSWPAASAQTLISRHLSRWTRSANASAALSPAHPVSPRVNRTSTIRARFKQAYLMTGTLAPTMRDPQTLPLKLFNTVLGGGMSSRLFVELREKMGLAYEISSFYPARRDPSVWAAYMGLPAERMEAAEDALNHLLKKIAQEGPTSAEIAQAKRMMIGSYVMDHQTRRRQAWYAGWWEFMGRTPEHDSLHAERVRAVREDDIRSAAKELLSKHRVTVKVLPK